MAGDYNMTHTENVEPKTEDFCYIPRAFILAGDCIPDICENSFPTVWRGIEKHLLPCINWKCIPGKLKMTKTLL